MNNSASHWQWRGRLSEALVIVTSILLAFAIDALWDERQERLEEQEILAALLEDFRRNRTEAAEVIKSHEAGRLRVAALAEMTAADAAVLSSDEADAILAALANPRTFDPARGTIDSLIGAGQLNIIQDRRLRDSLVSFINLSEDVVEDAAYLAQWSAMIWMALDRHGGPWRTGNEDLLGKEGIELGDFSFMRRIAAEDVSRIRGDSDLMGLILRNQIHAAHYTFEVRQVAAKIDEILALLEAQSR